MTRTRKGKAKEPSEKNTSNPFATSIMKGLDEALQYANGKDLGVKVQTFHIPEVDVKKVRQKMHLSQAAFSAKFGFPLATLRNWEQGRRGPELPARILLAVIERHPETVESVLTSGV